MANPKDMFYEYSLFVDQCLKSAVYIQDGRLKNAITYLNVATSPDTIFCCDYLGHRASLESSSYG